MGIYLFILSCSGSTWKFGGASSSSQVGEAVIRGVMLAAWTCSRDGELRSAKVCVCVQLLHFFFFFFFGLVSSLLWVHMVGKVICPLLSGVSLLEESS